MNRRANGTLYPLRLVLAATLFVSTSSGCAYRTPAVHIPKGMPAIAPASLEVTEVTVADTERALDGATAEGVRRDTADIVKKAAQERGAVARPGSTVVRAHVTLEERENMADRALNRDGIAIIGLWPVLFGMIHQRQKLSVDVDVETNGRSFHGHGTAERAGSLYSLARRRALAAALELALADAAAH